MRSSLLALPCLAALLAGSAAAQDLTTEANVVLGLSRSEVQNLSLPDGLPEQAVLQLELGGVPYTLLLEKRAVTTPDFQLIEIGANGSRTPHDPGEVRTYRGEVLEDAEAGLAASLLDDGLYARVRLSSGDDYFIEPLLQHLPQARFGDHVVYHNGDMLERRGVCGGALLAQEPGFDDPPGPPTYGAGTVHVAELGCDADFQYYQSKGSNVNNVNTRIQTVINAMNVQYEEDVLIRHDITTILVRTSSGPPYTSTDPGGLLNQFRAEWNANQGAIKRDVAELFTGKNLDGSVIGIAFLGVVCNKNSAYNVVQSDCCGSLGCATDLSAHELGHNWNADHCGCSGWTMNPSLTCANRFHLTDSIPDITIFRNSRNCLTKEDDGTVLFFDGFESGGFAAKGWTISSSQRCVVKPKSARDGAYGAKLKKGGVGTPACTVGTDQTWIESPTISTMGFASIELQLFAHFRKNELACEFLSVEWWDGAAWNVAAQIEKHPWDRYFLPLPAAAGNNPNFKVRLLTNAKGAGERAEVDDFCVIGN